MPFIDRIVQGRIIGSRLYWVKFEWFLQMKMWLTYEQKEVHEILEHGINLNRLSFTNGIFRLTNE